MAAEGDEENAERISNNHNLEDDIEGPWSWVRL